MKQVFLILDIFVFKNVLGLLTLLLFYFAPEQMQLLSQEKPEQPNYEVACERRKNKRGVLFQHKFNASHPEIAFQATEYCQLSLKVTDAQSSQPIEKALVRYRPLDTDTFETAQTNKQGYAQLKLLLNRQYIIQAFGRGYFFEETTIIGGYQIPCTQHAEINLMNSNQVMETHEVRFEPQSDQLDQASISFLDQLIQSIRLNPSLRLEIRVHTDSDGLREHNQQLSQKQAEAVVNYLIHSGKIAARQLSAVGLGENELKYPESAKAQDEGKKLNRRLELRWVR